MTPKQFRISQNLTLEQMAQNLGFAVGYISEVERGLKSGSLKLVREYHRISGGKVSYDDFPVSPEQEGQA